MVTVTITTIGLLGLSSLQLKANRSTLDSGNRSQAVWMIEDMANRIRANNISTADYDTGGNPVSCAAAPAKICTAYNDGSTRRTAATDCSGSEQAVSDLWEVACGFGSSVASSMVTRSSATDFIANPELTVSVDTNNRAVLTLSWDVRTSGTNNAGNAVYFSDSNNITSHRATISSVIQP